MKVVVLTLLCVAASFAANTKNLDVVTIIQSRFAQTTISSTIVNNKMTSDELKFQSILPKEAYITSFSMEIDGVWHDGVIEEKEEAERIFEKIKAKNKTAGIVRTRDESIKTFKTSVNIAAGKEVSFKLVYHQLLRRIRGKYLNRFILMGSQLSDRLTISVYICESATITNVTVLPSITADGKEINPDVTLLHEDNYAEIVYDPVNSNDPMITALSKSGGSFSVEYSLAVGSTGDFVIDNNFFMHFFDPNAEVVNVPTYKPRRVLFVLDSSGSMTGNKIRQMKEAIINILNTFDSRDRFGIIDFDSTVKLWKYKSETMTSATPEAIKDGQYFVRRLFAGGSTDIHGALNKAIHIMNRDVGESVETVDPESTYIVFLTDGQGGPAHIILNSMKLQNVKRIAIHAIGFGNSVDADFLKSLVAQNLGTWKQIFEDTNAMLQIQDYLNELGFTTVDGGLAITYPDIVSITTKTDRSKMAEGGELITIGRFKTKLSSDEDEQHTITIEQTKKGTRNITFTIKDAPPTCAAVKFASIKNYASKAFGIMEVNQILRKMDAETNIVLKEKYKNESIALSIKYKLVTPVTAMLVVTPEDRADLEAEQKAKEAERLRKEQEAQDKAKEAASIKDDTDKDISEEEDEEVSTTPAMTLQTTTKNASVPWWSTNGDPHFMVHLSEDITACFNWFGGDGDIYNLLTDSVNQVVVNGQLKETSGLFVSTIAVLSLKHNVAVIVEPRQVRVQDFAVKDKRIQDLIIPVMNTHSFRTTVGQISLSVNEVTAAHTLLNVTIDGNVSFVINLHHSNFSSDHLDLVIDHTDGLADHMSGVFGSFPKETRHGAPVASMDTIGIKHQLWFHDRLIAVERRAMDVPTIHQKVSCWFVPNASDILGHETSYFQLNRIYDIPDYVE